MKNITDTARPTDTEGSRTGLAFDDMTGEKRFFLNARLFPYRSMSKRSVKILITIIAILCTLAGFRFIIAGAWPVVIFVAVDIMAIWFAFHLSFRSARLFETVQLTEKDLILTRVHPSGKVENWRFEPYWTKAWIGEADELFIASNSVSVRFGSFLMPYEKREFLDAFNTGMSKWRHQGFETRQ